MINRKIYTKDMEINFGLPSNESKNDHATFCLTHMQKYNEINEQSQLRININKESVLDWSVLWMRRRLALWLICSFWSTRTKTALPVGSMRIWGNLVMWVATPTAREALGLLSWCFHCSSTRLLRSPEGCWFSPFHTHNFQCRWTGLKMYRHWKTDINDD